jgi:tetratricopeptide (TPR) repeat protein
MMRRGLRLWAVALSLASCMPLLPARADEAALRRGQTLQAEGKLAEALAAFERAASQPETAADAHRLSGHVLFELGRLDEARRELARALALGRLTPDILLCLAQIEEAAERIPAALEALRLGALLAERSADLELKLAEVALRAGREAEAEALLRRLVADEPARSAAHVLLGNLHLAARRPREALISLETAWHLGDGTPGLAAAIGELHLERGDAHRAALWCERAALAEPQRRGAHLLRQARILLGAGVAEAAEAAAETAAASAPAELQAAALLILGRIAAQRGDIEAAARHADAAAARGEIDSKLLAFLGDRHFERGDHERAAERYRASLRAGGEEAAVIDRLLRSLAACGRLEEAKGRLIAWVEEHGLDPNARAWIRLLGRGGE